VTLASGIAIPFGLAVGSTAVFVATLDNLVLRVDKSAPGAFSTFANAALKGASYGVYAVATDGTDVYWAADDVYTCPEALCSSNGTPVGALDGGVSPKAIALSGDTVVFSAGYVASTVRVVGRRPGPDQVPGHGDRARAVSRARSRPMARTSTLGTEFSAEVLRVPIGGGSGTEILAILPSPSQAKIQGIALAPSAGALFFSAYDKYNRRVRPLPRRAQRKTAARPRASAARSRRSPKASSWSVRTSIGPSRAASLGARSPAAT